MATDHASQADTGTEQTGSEAYISPVADFTILFVALTVVALLGVAIIMP
jgi:hypothetical protein